MTFYADPGWLALEFCPTDEDGAIFHLKDGTRHFHPVATIQCALAALSTDRDESRRLASILLAHAEHDGDALLFPYGFDFDYCGHIEAPWTSGMAQGQAVSLFVRLGMLANAKAAMAGLLRHVWWDGDAAWISEYPTDPVDPVLNGHVFGLMGAWDYRQATGKGDGLVQAGLNAIRPYRDRMLANWYDRDARFPAPKYDPIHRWQLRWLDAVDPLRVAA